jgi:shikimate dehydrogenase
MIDARPRIIVSLPGRSLEEVRPQIEAARESGADLAEVRFDRWPPDRLGQANQLFPSSLPLIATLRSRAEGGEGPDDALDRSETLIALARLPFEWIDLEEARDASIAARLPPSPSPGRILSTHLPESPEPRRLGALLEGIAPPGTLRKVVVPATVHVLFREILPMINDARLRGTTVMTTGASGPLLRAWSGRLDFPTVYACLPESAGPSVEPSQIPVDRLRSFLDARDNAPMFAILGQPVAHSRSPRLHSRWMREQERRGLYIALEIENESELVGALDPLAEGGFRGVNVTHPWKIAAYEAASQVARGAESCGAASCLTFRDGEVEAENTDLAALLRRLDELREEGRWDGKEVAVIGAGGSAAASLAAVREEGASATVFARDARRGKAIAERFGANVGAPPEARPFSLVIHATDVGRAGAGTLEVPLAQLLAPGSHLLDWVYAADDAVIAETCRRSGSSYEDGWRLLVYQAAASFGIWWGSEPDRASIEAAIAGGP